MWLFFTFVDQEIFFLLFFVSKTINISNEKWKLLYLEQYSHIEISNSLCENYIHLDNMGETFW